MNAALLAIGVLWLAMLVAARRSLGSGRFRLLPGDAAGAVDVIVPARNEEARLGPCLESLVRQRHPAARILVVDDRSTDGTAGVIAGFQGVERVEGRGPPAGWNGKVAALVEGASRATAEWLLFVDADVRLAADNLGSALAAAREVDGVTLWGAWDIPFPARLLHSTIGGIVRGTHPLDRVNDPTKSDSFLNGQYLLVRRESLAGIGGWQSVASEQPEDLALGRRAKAAGLHIRLLLAPERMRVQAAESLGDVWRSYRKNFAAGCGGRVPALLLAGFVTIVAIVPWLYLPRPAAVFACVACVLYRAGTARLFHHPIWEASLAPIANLLFVLFAIDAAIRPGGLWKGRGA